MQIDISVGFLTVTEEGCVAFPKQLTWRQVHFCNMICLQATDIELPLLIDHVGFGKQGRTKRG